MQKRVAVIGDDVAALLAAYEVSRHGYNVTIFHAGKIGIDAVKRPQIVHSSGRFLKLLDRLQLVHSDYRTRIGILLKDKVQLYPNHLRDLGRDSGNNVRADLFEKSRLVKHEYAEQLTDYEALVPKSAVRFNWYDFVESLGKGAALCGEKLVSVGTNELKTVYSRVTYDFAFVTAPLWEMRHLTEWRLPDCTAVAVNSVNISSGKGDKFASWDNVWTPYTPEGLIHRLVQLEDGYNVHFSGSWDETTRPRLVGDLNYLFPGGWHPNQSDVSAPGYMFPLAEEPVWPDNVCPLGRFAAWDQRSSLDVCLDQIHRTGRLWGL
jgi:hypothetical protein